MSLDIDKIKSKLQDLQKKSGGNGGGGNLYWKPSEGEQVIRVVPYKENPSNPFIEMYFHYGFGGETLVSPASFGDPDPIYEFSQKLRKQGDDESYKQSKKFEPKMRTHLPIIVRGEEDQGIRYWGFGKTVYEDLLGYMADPDWGDITHPKTGRDIKLTYEVPEGWPKNKSNGFPSTTVRPKPNPTKALDDLEKLKEMMDKLPPMKKLNEALSYAELEKKLKDYIGGDSGDNDTPTPKSESKPEEKKEKAPWESKGDTSNVEETFDELFASDD